jgi:nicotinate-nucleotide adenylyltransferase
MAAIGILGGTFNPPHVGHLLLGQEALVQLGLERVLLVPVHTPSHKEAAGDPGPQARVELCRLASGDDDRFEVSTVEVDRGGSSFTVDTLRELDASRPGDQLTFVVGGDMARALPSWREPEAVVSLARLAVAERGEARREAILSAVRTVPGAEQRVVFFEMPRVDISSSLVRERVAAGKPVRYLVPDAVADAIAAQGLYAASSGTPTT